MHMSRVRKSLFIVAALVVAPFTAQIPGCVLAHMPKEGTVIDVETNKGMPNVTVIAAARFYQQGIGWGGSNHSDLYSIVTTTDENGHYSIPATWLDMKIGVPGADRTLSWMISALEPGYALVGDEKGWEFDERGFPRYHPTSTVSSPQYSGGALGSLHIEPLRMYRVDLALKEGAVYYGSVMSLVHAAWISKGPEVVAMRRTAYDYLVHKVCSTRAEDEFDRTTLDRVMGFALRQNQTYELFKKMEPVRYQLDSYDASKYTAGMMCTLITEGRGSP